MELKEAIEHTKNKKGMKCSMSGMCKNAGKELDRIGPGKRGANYAAGYAYSLREMASNYDEAREAWLKGDLETVAEFFGLYV